MGVPLNLQDIQSGFLTASTFNENNTLTEQALAKALNRTSNASDNAMEVDLDMGLNSIFNLKDAVYGNEATTLNQVNKALLGFSDKLVRIRESRITATAGQTLFVLQSIDYTPGANQLTVYVNGVAQVAGIDYLETAKDRILFTSALQEGDYVDIYINETASNNKTEITFNTTYRSVAEMVVDNNLVVGSLVQTTGYYTPGDGGGNAYEIVAGGTGTADGGSFINLDNGLQAKSTANTGTINVKQWGAVSDGVTDDSPYFNAAASYAKQQQFRWENEGTGTTFNQSIAFEFIIPPGQYRINNPVDFTSIRVSHSWWYVRAEGAVIFGDCPGKTIFDFTDSRKCSWIGGNIICDNDINVTRSGFQLGRAGGVAAGRPADSHHFQDLEIKGYFTLAAIYNYASEDSFFEHVALKNDYDDVNAYCIVQDGTHYWGIESDFVPTQPLNTAASFLRNTFLRFDARKTNSGGPVWICSQATNHEMITSYLVGYSTQAIKVFYNIPNSFKGFVCDIHLETDLNDGDPSTGLQRAFTFDAASLGTTASIEGLKFRDNYPHCQSAVFVPEANIDTLDIINADVDLGTAGRLNEAVIFGIPSKIGFSGRLRYDANDVFIPNYENGFNSLRYFHGEIEVRDATTRANINQLKGNPLVIDRNGVYQKNGHSNKPGSTGRFKEKYLRSDLTESSYIEANTNAGVDTLTISSNGTEVARFNGNAPAFYPATDSAIDLGTDTLRWKVAYSDRDWRL
jgi:hypothetical protein